MLNKDKRSIVVSLVLGDGCFHFTSNRVSAALTIDHGLEQADYQAWKAEILSEIFERNVRVRTGHNGKSVQLSVCDKKFKVWRKFIYKDGKKDISRALRMITNPTLAFAVWLMDDGYCEPSFSKLADGSKKNYGARFRLFVCDQNEETCNFIKNWLNTNFNINCKILRHLDKRSGKMYPLIKFGTEDSLKLWEIIRTFVLRFKSMQHKFRYIEQLYKYRMAQRNPSEN